MGTNSEQAIQAFNQGMDLFKNLERKTSKGRSGTGEAEARLLETDARGEAMEARREAEKKARRVRDDGERARSGERAAWGGSNLEMSGSKAVVRDARRIKDMQEEDDVLYEGRRTAESVLRQARNRANTLRINSGSSPVRSTLSLGAGVYGPRR